MCLMKLIELEPMWLSPNVFIFRNPTGRGAWLLCKDIVMKRSDQYSLVNTQMPEIANEDIIPCEVDVSWKFSNNNNFKTLTVTPSLNANKSGNWHGHITKGTIIGGLDK